MPGGSLYRKPHYLIPNHIEDYASKKVLDQKRFCVPIKALQQIFVYQYLQHP